MKNKFSKKMSDSFFVKAGQDNINNLNANATIQVNSLQRFYDNLKSNNLLENFHLSIKEKFKELSDLHHDDIDDSQIIYRFIDGNSNPKSELYNRDLATATISRIWHINQGNFRIEKNILDDKIVSLNIEVGENQNKRSLSLTKDYTIVINGEGLDYSRTIDEFLNDSTIKVKYMDNNTEFSNSIINISDMVGVVCDALSKGTTKEIIVKFAKDMGYSDAEINDLFPNKQKR